MLAQLNKVLAEVQARFRYHADIGEHWASPKEIGTPVVNGDCEDHALMCREALNKLGIKNRLHYCKVNGMPEGENGHLVCEVDGYILDNRYPEVIRNDQLDYTWVSHSGYEAGDDWRLTV